MRMDGLIGKGLRLLIGVLILSGTFWLLAAGPCPPGAAGEVIRHNRDHDVQATALFYLDLDRMPELESALGDAGSNRGPGTERP